MPVERVRRWLAVDAAVVAMREFPVLEGRVTVRQAEHIVDRVLAALSPATDKGEVERLREALHKIERAYREWDPDASFASTKLAGCSHIARAALQTNEEAHG